MNNDQSEKKQNQPKPEEKIKKASNAYKNYAKYSGLGFQIVLSLLAGFFLGQQLDKWLNTSNPWFTILMVFVFFAGSMVFLIKKLPK